MDSIRKTSLWRASFENSAYDDNRAALKKLSESLTDIRQRVGHLVSCIPEDIPGLTVHDLTHLDALWETASLIAGEDCALNPAEAYVFGAAVLMHDSAMSLAAYPGGIADIKQSPEWRDAVANRLLELSAELDEELLNNPPENVAKTAIADVLREKHAQQALELPLTEWPTADGGRERIIQDSNLREAYGNIIGDIAASHWSSVHQLADLAERVNAGPDVPGDWHISPIRIACLLRVADAAHIDHRRAPRFLWALRQPEPQSNVHWQVQSKLGKPSIDDNQLIYTSGRPFTLDEAEAWWLGYDLLTSLDDELRSVHSLLKAQGLPTFAALSVKGAKFPHLVAKLVQTRGWDPVDTQLQVSDVKSLVSQLGGQRLYGSNLAAPVRELIQNAADACRMRRYTRDTDGEQRELIIVRLRREESGDWLDIEDNGVGMSTKVLTGPLLDFGRSFWRSSMFRKEFPGLLSKGVRSTGKFGIGFFSVFMLGQKVTVTSRKYDAGVAKTKTLDFHAGLRVRPILRAPNQTETLDEGGTRVSVLLDTGFDSVGGLLHQSGRQKGKEVQPLGEFIAEITPTLDVCVKVIGTDGANSRLEADEWLHNEPDVLVRRAGNTLTSWYGHDIKSFLPNLRNLTDPTDGSVHGRACIVGTPSHLNLGVITVGGFSAAKFPRLAGILCGETDIAARNSAMPTVPTAILREWASEQGKLIAKQKLSFDNKLSAAAVVLLCGGQIGDLPFVVQNNECLNITEIKEILRNSNVVRVYEGIEISYDEGADEEVAPRDFRDSFEIADGLLLVPQKASPIMQVGQQYWPECLFQAELDTLPTSCCGVFEMVLAQAWNCEAEHEEEESVVGAVDGFDVVRTVRVYTRDDHDEEEDPLHAEYG
jgi:hypothetical protein